MKPRFTVVVADVRRPVHPGEVEDEVGATRERPKFLTELLGVVPIDRDPRYL